MLGSPLLLGVLLRNLYGHRLHFGVFSQATLSPGRKRKTRSQGRARVPPKQHSEPGPWTGPVPTWAGAGPAQEEHVRCGQLGLKGWLAAASLHEGKREEPGHSCPAGRFQEKREFWWAHPKVLSSSSPPLHLDREPLGPSGPSPQDLQAQSPSRTTLLTFLFHCRTS